MGSITDANGALTTLTYDTRGRLTGRTVAGEATSYDYDAAGELIKVTRPDASYLTFDHDDAHRLTSIADNADNHIDYTLDAMGNRTGEALYDSSSTLLKSVSRVYDTLNRLQQFIGVGGQ